MNHDKDIAFFHGWVVAQAEHFANGVGLSSQELTYRLGELLLPPGSGGEDRMPVVPGTRSTARKALAEVALDGGSHSAAQIDFNTVKTNVMRMTPEALKNKLQEFRERQRLSRKQLKAMRTNAAKARAAKAAKNGGHRRKTTK